MAVFKSNTFPSASFCFPSIRQAVIFTSEKVWVTVMSLILSSLSFSPPPFFCLLPYPFYTLVWINDMTLARQNSTMCPSYSIFSIWERERNLKYLMGQHIRPENDLARLSFLDNVYLMSHRDHREWVKVCESETKRAGNVGWEQKRGNKWEVGGWRRGTVIVVV